jgi:hypothetical protein
MLPALLIALAGCGGSAHAPPTGSAADEPTGSAQDYEQRIARMQDELAATLESISGRALVQGDLVRPSGQSLGEPPRTPAPAGSPTAEVPDCSAAGDLRDRICELAERICAIAERDPDDGDLQAKCDSARAACARAHEDVARRCDDP